MKDCLRSYQLLNSTSSTSATTSAATTAAAIFTLLYGRWPCTSPVTPLMQTWNGAPA